MSADPITIFDRRAWRLHRDRAARTGCVDFLHAEVADRLVERLDSAKRHFDTVLDLGAHNGALSRAIGRQSGIGRGRVVTVDPSLVFLKAGSGMPVAADPELIPFREGQFDLVISALALHWVGDLPGTLIQLRRVMRLDADPIFGGVVPYRGVDSDGGRKSRLERAAEG